MLRDAAVVGDTVPTGVIEALRERRAASDARPGAVAAVELERAVDELLQRRMLHRVRGGYAFTTPLMREAAYAGHRQGRPGRPARLPGPLGRAGDASTALGYDGAGRLSLAENERDAFVATHAECAVELADAVRLRPDAAARDGRAARAWPRWAGWPAGRWPTSSRPPRSSTPNAPPPSPRTACRCPTSSCTPARCCAWAGPTEALAYGEKIAENAADEPVCRAEALLVVGRAHEALGDTGRAVAAWQEALEVATEAELRPGARQRDAPARHGRLPGRPAQPGEQPVRRGVPGDAGRRGPARAGLGAAEPGLGDHHPGRLRRHRRGARAGPPGSSPSWATRSAGPGCAAPRRSPGCWPAGCSESRRLARIFLPFGERVGEAWAVGTLRAVEAYAAAELGELAEADGEARRAYRDFAAVSDDWGRGLALVVRGAIARGPGRARARLRPAHRRAGVRRPDRPPAAAGHGRHAARLRGAAARRPGGGRGGRPPGDAPRSSRTIRSRRRRSGPRVLLAEARLRAGDAATAVGLLAPIASDTGAVAALLPAARAGVVRVGAARRRPGGCGADLDPRGPGRCRPRTSAAGWSPRWCWPGCWPRPDRCDEARAAAEEAVLLGVLDGAGQRAGRRPRNCGTRWPDSTVEPSRNLSRTRLTCRDDPVRAVWRIF